MPAAARLQGRRLALRMLPCSSSKKSCSNQKHRARTSRALGAGQLKVASAWSEGRVQGPSLLRSQAQGSREGHKHADKGCSGHAKGRRHFHAAAMQGMHYPAAAGQCTPCRWAWRQKRRAHHLMIVMPCLALDARQVRSVLLCAVVVKAVSCRDELDAAGHRGGSGRWCWCGVVQPEAARRSSHSEASFNRQVWIVASLLQAPAPSRRWPRACRSGCVFGACR